jgi:hypothetical protein
MSIAVLRILADSPDGEASIRKLKKQIPDYVRLSEGDLKASLTRRGEALWEQIVRNIVSHKKVAGNLIAEGYVEHRPRHLKITKQGRAHLKTLGH